MKKWVCVARLGSIGDDLIVSSVLPGLKAQGYMVEVIAQGEAAQVFENNPHVDKLVVMPQEDIPNTSDAWREFWRKRAKEYDKFYHLSYSVESHVAFHPDNAAFAWPQGYRRKLADKSYLALTHDICELPHEFGPEFFPTDEERRQAEETKIKVAPLGQPVIGWVISGSRIDKLYPPSALAIARIIKELGVSVVLFGALNEKEWKYAETIQEHVRLTNGSLLGLHLAMGVGEKGEQVQWPLRRSITQLQHCDLVVSPDTGLAWGVAMKGMPKIILLGHASPKNITHGWRNTITLHADASRVPCHPCHQLHNDVSTCRPNAQNNGAACISDISVECLIDAIRYGLGDQKALGPLRQRFASNLTLPETFHAGQEVLGVREGVQSEPSALCINYRRGRGSPSADYEIGASQRPGPFGGSGGTVHDAMERPRDADAGRGREADDPEATGKGSVGRSPGKRSARRRPNGSGPLPGAVDRRDGVHGGQRKRSRSNGRAIRLDAPGNPGDGSGVINGEAKPVHPEGSTV